jgi:hypothetical protein
VVYTWNEDTEPPVIDPPDGGDLGCNPVPPECPIIIQQTTVTDNCPHLPPTVECRSEDRRDGCIVTRTFTITATDKCGNQSTATVTYTWNEDTEPPVVNNVPETDKLPCNTRPTCDLLIARHNIHAKDNCTHEPPTLRCEPGEVVDLGNCRFRQTFTFWAVDKCGNRSRDYQLVVFWKEDTEPPVLHNVPEDRDLGCNPTHIPDCDEIRSGVYATDNCDPDVRVTCTYPRYRDWLPAHPIVHLGGSGRVRQCHHPQGGRLLDRGHHTADCALPRQHHGASAVPRLSGASDLACESRG